MSGNRSYMQAPLPPAERRTLENPPARLPLPGHLGYAFSYNLRGEFARVVRLGVAASQQRFSALPRLNIAWPQKHPFDNHRNAATSHAQTLQTVLQGLFRGKDVILAHAIHETVRLNRSEDSSALHAMTGRQSFAVDSGLQDEPLPFLSKAGMRGECFVLTDWFINQGTTIAALASFIHHNGGHVVAIATPCGGAQLRPDEQAVPRLAACFSRASRGGLKPAETLARFDRALAPHGRAVATLTHGEILALERCITAEEKSFESFIDRLNERAAPRRDRGVAPC